MRQRARADNFTVCYRKKTNGSQFFMRLSCYRQCYDEIHDQQQTHKNLTSIWKLDKIALLSQHSGQNGIIFLLYQGTMMISLSLACMYFHFSSMRISFITWKLQESTKLRQLRERHKLPFWFCFLNSIPGDRTEISHMDRPQNSCQLPSQPAYQDHMRRPSHCKWWLLVKIIVLLNNTRSTAHDFAFGDVQKNTGSGYKAWTGHVQYWKHRYFPLVSFSFHLVLVSPLSNIWYRYWSILTR